MPISRILPLAVPVAVVLLTFLFSEGSHTAHWANLVCIVLVPTHLLLWFLGLVNTKSLIASILAVGLVVSGIDQLAGNLFHGYPEILAQGYDGDCDMRSITVDDATLRICQVDDEGLHGFVDLVVQIKSGRKSAAALKSILDGDVSKQASEALIRGAQMWRNGFSFFKINPEKCYYLVHIPNNHV